MPRSVRIKDHWGEQRLFIGRTLFAGIGHQSNQYGTLAGLRSGTAQDQIVAGSAVPAPGTLAAAGLIGLAGLRRRR